MGEPHGVGIVGLGVILEAYLATLADHPRVRIVAVADLDPERVRTQAERLGARGCTLAEMLDMPEVETVLDLTTPAAHAAVALACAAAGKHRLGEKPIAATLSQAFNVVEAAGAAGTMLGCAPDTVLGTGVQTARACVDGGRIGRPTSAVATWISPGHESWHPNPDFYYAAGGGPLLDMGPYYLTSLVHLLGPVRAVTGAASSLRGTRTIGSGPRAGQSVPVEVATHVAGTLEHVDGAISTITVSFDGFGSRARPIEVHGEDGSLVVPDPNGFGGTVEVLTRGDGEWREVPPSAGFVDGSRGVGLLEMVGAAGLPRQGDGSPRASGAIGLHVMDIMSGLLDSAREGSRVLMATCPQRPEIVPLTPFDVWHG